MGRRGEEHIGGVVELQEGKLVGFASNAGGFSFLGALAGLSPTAVLTGFSSVVT